MPETNSKWLTFLVYFLLAILTLTQGWSSLSIATLKDNLPKEFVRLERYKCDQEKLEKQIAELKHLFTEKISGIENKLDRLLWPSTGGLIPGT